MFHSTTTRRRLQKYLTGTVDSAPDTPRCRYCKLESDGAATLGTIERLNGSYTVTDAQKAAAVIHARPPQFASVGNAVLFIEELFDRIEAARAIRCTSPHQWDRSPVK